MSGLTGNNILGGSSGQSTGYNIDQSLRFNDDDGTYLSKAAPGAAGNLNNWTVSVWLKRGQTTGLLSGSWEYQFFGQGDASSNPVSSMSFSDYSSDANKLVVSLYGTSDSNLVCKWSSDPLYRDHSAWYHVVVKWDNTQSAAADILKVYVNGEVVSGTFGTSPSNGTTTVVNKDFKQFLGKYVYGTQPNWWDGYMAEYHFIDGQSLTSASFGETNSDTNQWVPIEYEGTYGTQGWYLNFSDSSSLGADSSGNGNNFTANVLTATDQVLDSPTNNFATLNPLDPYHASSSTFTEGNLKATEAGGSYQYTQVSNLAMSSGKWYFEFCGVNSDNTWMLGIADVTKGLSRGYTGTAGDGLYVYVDGDKYAPTSASSYGVSWTYGDVMGVAVDMDNNAMYIAKNNTWMNSSDPTSGASKTGAAYTTELANKTWVAAMGRGGYPHTITGTFNFGQDSSFAGAKTEQGNGGVGEDFYYTPPTGFKALNTNNIDEPSIALPTDHFNTLLYTGNGTAGNAITGVGFSADFIWIKNRTTAYYHNLADTVRGITKGLNSNATDAENSYSNVQSVQSDGFTVGANALVNGSSENLVSWNWKAGGTASSNTDGTITSSVSANPTAGFSIASYTGNATAGATVGHGLSQAPEMIIVKGRNNALNWIAYHSGMGSTDFINFNTIGAKEPQSSYNMFNSTAPSSTVFSLGNLANTNSNTLNYISYCFHSVEGYSKVGSYTGNGSTDGNYVYTGFTPQWLMVKQIDSARDWIMYDNKRSEFNVMGDYLHPNLSNAGSSSGSVYIDFLSNGFKWRSANTAINVATGNYIYLAFAESPFKYSNAR